MEKIFWVNKNKYKLLDFKNFKNSSNHAYLILGSQNVGKSTYAKEVAKIFLCSQNSSKYCGKCQSCILTEKKQHPDLVYIKPDNAKNPKISISTIQDMRKSAQLSSSFGGYKVFVIESADKLTREAQNALLKTLEEPTPKTIFILTIVSEKLILPTIYSRCQKIKIPEFSREDLKNFIKSYAKKNADLISRYSLGRPGTALKMIEDEELFNNTIKKFEEAIKIIKSENIVYRFKKSEEWINQKIQKEMLYSLEIIFRDLLQIKLDTEDLLINILKKDDLEKISEKYSYSQILEIIKKIGKIKSAILFNVNPKFAFENLMLSI